MTLDDIKKIDKTFSFQKTLYHTLALTLIALMYKLKKTRQS
jgi:hypothetical protein